MEPRFRAVLSRVTVKQVLLALCVVFVVAWYVAIASMMLVSGKRTPMFKLSDDGCPVSAVNGKPEWKPSFVDKALNPGLKEMHASPLERMFIDDIMGED